MEKSPNLGFSLVAWHELSYKCSPASRKIEDLLSPILLQKYGQGLNEIFFVHIIVQPDTTRHQNRRRYEKKDKILYISWRVDYEKFVEADSKTATRLMATTYLECILLFKKWRIPNFDYLAFYNDVQQVFEENQIL